MGKTVSRGHSDNGQISCSNTRPVIFFRAQNAETPKNPQLGLASGAERIDSVETGLLMKVIISYSFALNISC
jgi:hypothetical protein